ncbi:hypothetical protein SCP_0906080 [Sparassis crispa]|uniref:Uncharacterized protein n=1 Tax=Sparassis crispa TaxID=139825 RepID=A0A401GWW8_9APHY|nr:hypothetical protein SCP_0906080 [Sparassis crispa]GBE86728.1 hypothetical protein SCP_0906080 [Sparassis crispa]
MSSPNDGSHTQSSDTSRQLTGHQFEQEGVIACEAAVEEFRKSKISKAEASIQLLEAISYHDTAPEEEAVKRSAYAVYLAELDEIESAQREAGDRGAIQAPGPLENSAQILTSSEALEPSSAVGDKRKRDASDDSDSEQGKKVDESLFPFPKSLGPSLLSPELQLTLKLKENYTRDLALSRQRVVCHPDCPNVSESIFTAFYTIDGDLKQSIKLGDLEVTASAPVKPSWHISRH